MDSNYQPYTLLSVATLILCLGFSLCFAVSPLQAQEDIETDQDVIILAKTLQYDKNKGLVVATGEVEVTFGSRVLLSDKVIYDLVNDKVSAEGNVSLLESNSNVLFADSLELTQQLRSGTIKGFKALLATEARFAAVSAERRDGNLTIMQHALYSPCEVCEDKPGKAPLWQLRAEKISHDEKRQLVNYQNVRLEIYGVPIFYTPYFSHPDHTVDRKTGFLVPTQGHSTQLGTTLRVPFFVNIAPNIDTTLEPIMTSKEGVVLASEFRHHTQTGSYSLEGSITRPQKRDDKNDKVGGRSTRSHLFASGQFDWNNTWRWGFDGAIASDDTYLRRYGLSDIDNLTNTIAIEGLNGRNYASANVHFFQGLRATDDPGQTPLVFPLLHHKYVGEPDRYGRIFKLDSNFLHLTRNDGIDSTRLSFRGGWHLPKTSKRGDRLTVSLEFKADGYVTNDVPSSRDPSQTNSNSFVGRLVPQLSSEWRWPLVKRQARSRQLVEPIVVLVASPYGGNPGDIPNEDSQSFEFDDTNVFSANRFPGLDRVEGGARANVGLKYGIYGNGGGSAEALLGQVFKMKVDDTFADRTGLENKQSDYVGRIALSPSTYLDYYQRFRLDRDTLSLRRNEIGLNVGPPVYSLNLTYLSLSRELTADELIDREEVAAKGRARLSKYWFLTGHTRHDLTDSGGTINSGYGLEYQDECFSFMFDFERDFTRDRELEPNTTISFRIRLKNLG